MSKAQLENWLANSAKALERLDSIGQLSKPPEIIQESVLTHSPDPVIDQRVSTGDTSRLFEPIDVSRIRINTENLLP